MYEVSAVLGYGFLPKSVRSIGTLGIPSQVPVLPPDADMDWDVTAQLAHFPVQGSLWIEIMFRDPAGVEWHRRFDGVLLERRRRSSIKAVAESKELEEAYEQLGQPSPENPIWVAMSFLQALRDERGDEKQLESLRSMCTPESRESWGDFSDVRSAVADRGIGTFPEYPAPGVCYVRLPDSPSRLGKATGPVPVDAAVMTLQRRPDICGSWHIHSLEVPCPPEYLPPLPAGGPGEPPAEQT